MGRLTVEEADRVEALLWDEPCRLSARERTLPLWAQEALRTARFERHLAEQQRDRVEEAHQLLTDRAWFPIHGKAVNRKGTMQLWLLFHDDPSPVCDLGPNDVLLVGRARQ